MFGANRLRYDRLALQGVVSGVLVLVALVALIGVGWRGGVAVSGVTQQQTLVRHVSLPLTGLPGDPQSRL
jgi:hypothetical protein